MNVPHAQLGSIAKRGLHLRLFALLMLTVLKEVLSLKIVLKIHIVVQLVEQVLQAVLLALNIKFAPEAQTKLTAQLVLMGFGQKRIPITGLWSASQPMLARALRQLLQLKLLAHQANLVPPMQLSVMIALKVLPAAQGLKLNAPQVHSVHVVLPPQLPALLVLIANRKKKKTERRSAQLAVSAQRPQLSHR